MVEDGIYISQHCEKCAYDWHIEIISLTQFFQEVKENKATQIGVRILDAIREIILICPECGSDRTTWSYGVKANSKNYSMEEFETLKSLLDGFDNLFKKA